MIGKVHYHNEASDKLAKKELRKAFCSGARSSALYSSNLQLVSCLFCKSKYVKLKTAKRKARLLARLPGLRRNIEINENLASYEKTSDEQRERCLKYIEGFRQEIQTVEAAIAGCNALLGSITAAGAPDHEEE